ncbi:MAG: DUF885 domain-containing protein [Candidatus Sericytochromatia bacterium]
MSADRQARIQAENELQVLFRQQHEFKRRSYPEWATYDGDHRFDDRLTDLSHEAAEMRCQKNRGFLRELKAIDPALLTAEDQLHHQLFGQMLTEEIRFHELGLDLMNIDQQEGMHLKFPQLVEIQPLESYDEYEQYFSRLQSFEKQVSDTLANLELGLQRGRILPRPIVQESLKQMAALAGSSVDDMPLMQPVFAHQHSLPEHLRERVAEMARRLIRESVQPAYARLHDFVRDVYLPAAPEQPGLCHQPDGEAIYRYWMDRHTAPGLTPEGLHSAGMNEVARILATLEPLLERTGLPRELSALQAELRSNPAYYFSRAEDMMAAYQVMLDEAQSLLPQLFHNLPRSGCVLKEMEPWRAAAAPQAYYYPPPQDLSRPGVYYVNTHDLASRPRYSMMALTLHEAVPGHHLQLARALEKPALPDFRYHLEATAFVEGWALYAEALGHEMGLYADPLQAIGALSFELWRACRLVVDTGLHALGWSRQQAVDYFRAHTLQSETDIQSEIDRYLALPAQALAYKTGELELRALRQQAEDQLGPAFDLRDFHELLLEQGSVPLNVIQQQVTDWLQRQL